MSDTDRSAQATGGDAQSGGISTRVIRAGQIAGAITAVVTAVLLLWNTLLKPAAAPAVLRGSIASVEVHADRPLHVYLDSHPGQLAHFIANAKSDGLAGEEIGAALKTPGVLAEFTISLDGPAGRQVELTHILYNERTEARVPEGAVRVVGAERYVSQSGGYQSTQSLWLQSPPSKGAYFLEIDLVEPNGQTLTTKRSPIFTVP
jgi:hypothetical protein